MQLSPRWSYLVRLVLSIMLFGTALYVVEWPLVWQMLLTISLGWLGLHLLAMVVERLVFTWKWHGLLTARGVDIPIINLLVITLVGKFWGMFLPSSVGVDVVRGYYLYRYTGRGADSASSVLVDKIIALWALLLIGSVGLVVYGKVFDGPEIGFYLLGIMALTAACLYVAVRPKFADWLSACLPRMLGDRVGGSIGKLYSSLLSYQDHPAALVRCFLLALLMQFLRILGAWTMASALGIEIPFIYYFLFIPVSMLLIMLPVSIGGFGMREGVLVALFALAGFSTTDAFALGFGVSITDLASSLVGGLVYLFVRIPVATDAVSGRKP